MLIEDFMKRSRFTILILALLATACSGEGGSYSPTAPTPPLPSPGPSASSNWTGDSTVVSVSSTRNGCTASTVGETTNGFEWEISVSGKEIELRNLGENPGYPSAHIYSGSLNGRQFTATGSGQDGGWECFVLGGDLAGSFSEDGLHFEAVENIEYHHYGEDAMQVQRRWTGTRR